MADLREAVQDESFVDFSRSLQEQKAQTSPSTEISWSSIVKKSISLSDSQEGCKETDLEPLIEVEEKTEAGEHARKLKSKILQFCDRDDLPFFESGAGKHDSSRRRAFKVEEKEKEELLDEKDNVDETTMTRTRTTTVEETILIDLPPPVIDEEPHADRDLVGVTMARAKTSPHQDGEDNKEQSPLVPEVRSSVVDKTRRGNVPAERRESQRESSLQLQPQLRAQQVTEGGDPERNDPTPALSVSEDPAGSDACPKHAEKRSETESSTTAKKTSNRSKRKKRR